MGWGVLALLLTVIPLGIGAAFTPSLFAVQLLVVGNDPWRLRALGALLGAATAFGIALTVLLLGFARLPAPVTGGDPLGAVLKIAAGIALLAIAGYFAWPHPQLEQRVRIDIERRVQSASPAAFFGITFLLSIKDVSSFVLLVPAMHDIGVSDIPWPIKVAITLLVFALALAGLIIPPVLRISTGARGRGLLQRVYDSTMRNQFRIMAVVFGVLAIYLIALGARSW